MVCNIPCLLTYIPATSIHGHYILEFDFCTIRAASPMLSWRQDWEALYFNDLAMYELAPQDSNFTHVHHPASFLIADLFFLFSWSRLWSSDWSIMTDSIRIGHLAKAKDVNGRCVSLPLSSPDRAIEPLLNIGPGPTAYPTIQYLKISDRWICIHVSPRVSLNVRWEWNNFFYIMMKMSEGRLGVLRSVKIAHAIVVVFRSSPVTICFYLLCFKIWYEFAGFSDPIYAEAFAHGFNTMFGKPSEGDNRYDLTILRRRSTC